MMPVTVEKEITIAAKATTVWRFVGTEEGLRQWWGMDVALEAKQGGRCEERTCWQGRVCYLRGKVTMYNPPHQLTLFLQNEDKAEVWPAWTTISITLIESNEQTQVRLLHQAFGPLAVKPAIGQIGALPSTIVAPPVIWNLQQPQNSWNRGATATRPSTLAAPHSRPVLESGWLTQQELHWHDRLQRLAQQVLSVQETPEE